MRWIRCGMCRTLGDVDRFPRCMMCGSVLPSSRPPAAAPPPAEIQTRGDLRWAGVLLAVAAAMGVVPIVVVLLTPRSMSMFAGYATLAVLITAGVAFGIALGALGFRKISESKLQASGKVVLNVFVVLASTVLAIGAVTVGGFVLLFIVCLQQMGPH